MDAAMRKRFPIGLDKLGPQRVSSRSRQRDTALVSAAPTPALRAAASPVVAALRQRMVATLERDGAHARVLDVMAKVPRHAFVDAGLEGRAYEDVALPIGHEQTISSPAVVARMLSLLFEGASARRSSSLGRVLEVGTGCGYQAALLSMLGTSVISVEWLRPLLDVARRNLAAVDVRRHALRLVLADGRLGHPPNAPYDSIIAAAAGEEVPKAWIDQLAVGGRIVAPAHVGSMQALIVIDRHDCGITRTEHDPVRFVPLESGVIL